MPPSHLHRHTREHRTIAIKSYYDGGGYGYSDPLISGGIFWPERPGIDRNWRQGSIELIPQWHGVRPGGDLVEVSLGPGDIPVQQPGGSVPTVVSSTEPPPPPTLPPVADRRDEPLNEGPMEQQVTDDWFVYHDLQARGVPVLHTSQLPAQQPTPAAPIDNDVEEPVGWISDVYDIVDTAAGGWLPGGVPVGLGTNVFDAVNQPVYNQAPPPVQTSAPAPAPTPTAPGAPPVHTSSCSNNPYPGWVYKYHCGQMRWVKQSKRRRKRLATQSDIKDLSALIGLLGNGKQLQTWIATHGG